MKDVHTEHCCAKHGCKYGDDDCTVTTGLAPQSFDCESCDWDKENMAEDFQVNRYMVMKFDYSLDSLVQHSVSLGLENARRFLKKIRETFPQDEFSLVAVLDE